MNDSFTYLRGPKPEGRESKRSTHLNPCKEIKKIEIQTRVSSLQLLYVTEVTVLLILPVNFIFLRIVSRFVHRLLFTNL